jgi:hypothetical protein
MIIGRLFDLKLLEDVVDVSLDRLGAQKETVGDALVGAAFGDQDEDLSVLAGDSESASA